jgi:hypothetical protein
MTQKMAKKIGFARATLADIQKEMAKPRLAESVRADAEAAEDEQGETKAVSLKSHRETRKS